ncbi:hypothetical protein O3W44_23665 [Pantoea sp. LMR881]|nr:hypothetical protein [Pantoea sp. LMR881]MCZ4061493.1 hypothetical protein [Pantoea sp. LMR881]
MDNWQALMSPDCTHPSSELYKNKAQATFAVLEKSFGTQLAAYQKNMQTLDQTSVAKQSVSPQP